MYLHNDFTIRISFVVNGFVIHVGEIVLKPPVVLIDDVLQISYLVSCFYYSSVQDKSGALNNNKNLNQN